MAIYQGWDPPRPGWVCAECGFDYDAVAPESVAGLLGPFVADYRARLSAASVERLRQHPAPSTWSALEYGCHVRDALALYVFRVGKVLAEDRPEFPPMNRDAAVVERAYNEQEPAAVAADIAANAAELAQVLGRLRGADWRRAGVRQGEEMSIAWMAVNALHEVRHHLMDVERSLEGATQGDPEEP